ncbi:MAG: hypothetical protein KIT73_09760 [Burkholderiales bacterium]|nr:hypothetical protein [Burkholderiales bacterium]
MNIRIVTRVRIDDSGRVTHVQWHDVLQAGPEADSGGAAVVDVRAVVDAIRAGDAVLAEFPEGRHVVTTTISLVPDSDGPDWIAPERRLGHPARHWREIAGL